MIYGDLEDPGNEFFIFKRLTTDHSTDERDSSIYGEVLHKITNNNATIDEIFDWNSSYILRLEYLPESHVSPRTASKIMFAGKAVKLLKSTNSSNNEQVGAHVKEVYDYLSSSFKTKSNDSKPAIVSEKEVISLTYSLTH
jgi:hypothetical protein